MTFSDDSYESQFYEKLEELAAKTDIYSMVSVLAAIDWTRVTITYDELCELITEYASSSSLFRVYEFSDYVSFNGETDDDGNITSFSVELLDDNEVLAIYLARTLSVSSSTTETCKFDSDAISTLNSNISDCVSALTTCSSYLVTANSYLSTLATTMSSTITTAVSSALTATNNQISTLTTSLVSYASQLTDVYNSITSYESSLEDTITSLQNQISSSITDWVERATSGTVVMQGLSDCLDSLTSAVETFSDIASQIETVQATVEQAINTAALISTDSNVVLTSLSAISTTVDSQYEKMYQLIEKLETNDILTSSSAVAMAACDIARTVKQFTEPKTLL